MNLDAFSKLSEQQKSLQEQIKAPGASVSKNPSDPPSTSVDQGIASDPKAGISKVSDLHLRPYSLSHLTDAMEVEFIGPHSSTRLSLACIL